MAKTYKITFTTKAAIGAVLYELNAWDVPHSSYEVHKKDWVIYHANANVVDVCTETIRPQCVTIEVE